MHDSVWRGMGISMAPHLRSGQPLILLSLPRLRSSLPWRCITPADTRVPVATLITSMEVVQLSNRFSAPSAYELAGAWTSRPTETVHSPDLVGELIGYEYAPETKARPSPHRDHLRRRPITFHEGYTSFISAEATDPFEGVGFFDDVDACYGESFHQHQGPTIGSIRCLDDTLHIFDEDDMFDASPEPVPILRLDTACPRAATEKSPLGLVSNFLGTLAGLVNSPSSTPIQRKATKRSSAIMIFDSEVLVDVMTEDVEDVMEDPDSCGSFAWPATSLDWEFLVPLSSSESCSRPPDPMGTCKDVEQDRSFMGIESLAWL